MMVERGLKPEAMLGVIASFAATSEADIRAIPTQTLVVCGDRDHDNGSPERLADLLPRGRVKIVSGDHTGAVGHPSLAGAIAEFLSAP
jgi:hypothetical protein